MSSPLYLVGIIHNDLRGPQRMLHLLDRLKPDIVSIENTIEGTAHWQVAMDAAIMEKSREGGSPKAGLEALANLTFQMVYGQDRFAWPIEDAVAYTFECQCAYAWSRLNDKRFVCAEPGRSTALIEAIDRYIRKHNAALVASFRDEAQPVHAFQESINACYADVKSKGLAPTTEDIEIIADRDAGMAATLAACEGCVVHFSGCMHMFGFYRNLAERLADHKPRLLTLLDSEGILSEEARLCCQALKIPIPTDPLAAAVNVPSY